MTDTNPDPLLGSPPLTCDAGELRDELHELRDELRELAATVARLADAFDRYEPLLDRFANNPAARFAASLRKG